jgi:hypothetical protein
MPDRLEVNESFDAITAREADPVISVLVYSALKVICDADVEVARGTRQNVDIELAHESRYNSAVA